MEYTALGKRLRNHGDALGVQLAFQAELATMPKGDITWLDATIPAAHCDEPCRAQRHQLVPQVSTVFRSQPSEAHYITLIYTCRLG